MQVSAVFILAKLNANHFDAKRRAVCRPPLLSSDLFICVSGLSMTGLHVLQGGHLTSSIFQAA